MGWFALFRSSNSFRYRQAQVAPTANHEDPNKTTNAAGSLASLGAFVRNYSKKISVHSPTMHSHNVSMSARDVSSNEQIEPPSVVDGASNKDSSNKSSSNLNVPDHQIVTPPKLNGKKYIPKMFDVWAFGITTVIGGQYYGWNDGLTAGFGSYCIAQIFMGFAYINLSCALAEIVSTTSFSGGAYGMARVVLGFYPGFIIAAFELMEYITYIASTAAFLGEFVIEGMGFSDVYTPVVCLLFYLLVVGFLIEEDCWYWRLNYILAFASLGILLIYCFGTLNHVNFIENASLKLDPEHNTTNMINWFDDGMMAFLRALPLATWGFGGIESAALVTDMIENPRVNLSYGMAYASLTLFATMIFILFVASSLPPGMHVLKSLQYFMTPGWQLLSSTISTSTAEWFMIPAQFAMAYGFFLPSCKLFHAIAQSNLMPTEILGMQKDNAQNHHKLVIFYVVFISYCFCLLVIYVPQIDLNNVAILLASITYLSDFYAFYRLRTDFQARNNDHQFVNPLGLPGMMFSVGIFLLNIIALLGCEPELSHLYVVIAYWIVLTIYYFGYAKSRQVFSADEQKSLLVLHVMQNNRWKRQAKHKRHLQQQHQQQQHQHQHEPWYQHWIHSFRSKASSS